MAYDVIVLGAGGVGSAALFELARRGARVLGLERFAPGHDRGSSHGQTRIIRQAYFEHPDYVPLLLRAYERWAELEARRDEQLFFPVGLLQIGPPAGAVVSGVLESASRHNLAVDRLSPAEARRAFRGFLVPADCEAVFERRAGYLRVEECVLAHLAEAEKLSAEIKYGEGVLRWSASAAGISVETASGRYEAGRLIIAAGAWAKDLLAGLGVRLRVLRKHLHWYACPDDSYAAARGAPTFLYDTPAGCFYGFPQIDEAGLKAAEHSGGAEVADPLNDDRSVDLADRRRVEAFLAANLPAVSLSPTRHATCFYTMSPDEHFLVDRHPDHENVCFAAGLSGHGFKFTCVLGEALADLALAGQTSLPIEFLRCTRPGLR